MAKLASRIRETVTQLLEPDEQLQEVAQLISHKKDDSTWTGAWVNTGMVGLYLNRDWHAGITNQRLILIPLNKFSKPQVDQVISLHIGDLDVTSGAVVAKLPGKNGPVKLHFHGGAKFATGLDRVAFLSAIHQQQQLQRS
jgi:hypothetical protein